MFVRLFWLTLFVAAPACAEPFAPVWSLPTGSSMPLGTTVDASGRPYLYAALKSGGVGVVDSATGRTIAAVATRDLGGLDAANLVQSGDRLYVALGDFFAAGGAKAGLAIIDVRDPRSPRVRSLWTSEERLNGSTAVVTDGRTVYLGAMREGVFVFDATASALAPLAIIKPDVNFPTPKPGRMAHPNARGLALRGDTLYVAYDAGGLRVVDVRDRAAPVEIGRYVNPQTGRKQQAYNNLVLDGDVAYVAVDYCGVEAVDIADPRAMRQMGWWNPWGCERWTNTWFNSGGHTNQIVLDAALRRLYVSGGDSELSVLNVSIAGQPSLMSSYGGVKDGRGTWGLAVGRDAVYLGYIKTILPFRGTWSGIEALSLR